MTTINKYFCDKCSKSRYGEVTFCSFDKHRDYKNHLLSKKHKKNCDLLENDTNSIACKYCSDKFSVDGFDVHKKRNERLWFMKYYIGNNYITCNRFQWEAGGRRFSSMDEVVNNRTSGAAVVAATATAAAEVKKKSLTEVGLVNEFSYLKSNENKSIEEKKAIMTATLIDEEKHANRPDLELCEDCSTYSKHLYFNPINEFTHRHLTLYEMEDCGCREIDSL